MENLSKIKYFCCEDRIVVRLIKDQIGEYEALEYYDPTIAGWIPSQNWYNDMFISKKVKFREITKEEIIYYINHAIEYFKREKLDTVYLRRIYGLDLEVLNDKTGKWEEEINDEWYLELDECVRVSREEVDNYIENLFSKKITR